MGRTQARPRRPCPGPPGDGGSGSEPARESTSIEFGELGPDASALGVSTLVVADLLNNGGQTILLEGDDVSPADLGTTPYPPAWASH